MIFFLLMDAKMLNILLINSDLYSFMWNFKQSSHRYHWLQMRGFEINKGFEMVLNS